MAYLESESLTLLGASINDVNKFFGFLRMPPGWHCYELTKYSLLKMWKYEKFITFIEVGALQGGWVPVL